MFTKTGREEKEDGRGKQGKGRRERNRKWGEKEDKVIIFADCKLHCGEAELRMKDYEAETKRVKYVDIEIIEDVRKEIKRQLMKNGMGRVPAEKLAWLTEGMVYSGIGTTNRKYLDAICELTGLLKVNAASGKKLAIADVKEMAEDVLQGHDD